MLPKETHEALIRLLELHEVDAEGKPMLRWFSSYDIASRVANVRKLIKAADTHETLQPASNERLSDTNLRNIRSWAENHLEFSSDDSGPRMIAEAMDELLMRRRAAETDELLSIARDLSTMDCFWSASGHHEADCKCLSGRAERAIAAHTQKAKPQRTEKCFPDCVDDCVCDRYPEVPAQSEGECHIRPHDFCSAGTCKVCVDAARYRWLQDNGVLVLDETLTGDALDIAVDAERRHALQIANSVDCTQCPHPDACEASGGCPKIEGGDGG